MKLWVDDLRSAPDRSWTHAFTVADAVAALKAAVARQDVIEAISLDHDLGDGAVGGDAIKLVLWMCEVGWAWPLHRPTVHSMNPVGRRNMEALIERYGPYD